MLSSADVSSLFAAQQSQFAQQNAYAQQLGLMAPQAPGSFFRPPPPSFPGMVAPPPAYSYAPSGFHANVGNRVAGGVMAGLGGAASLGGAALGAASMFGRMGALAPFLDPIAGGMAGFGAAGIGGAAAGVALPLALGYGASKAIGSFVGGGQQQSALNQTLSSTFGFVNPGSRTGQGFDRGAMQGVGQIIRQIADVPEMMTSVEELTKMVPKLKAMGGMQGVHDLKEFSRRFKEQIHTIRDMSKMLGTTMEEATEAFAHAKAVGMRTPQQQLQNTLAVQFGAAQTGMSTDQFRGMQMAGANMATGMGIRRSVGTKAVTNMSQMLQAGIDKGAISQESLEDLTGQTGAEAVGGASQMMVSRMTQFAQGTSAGRLMMFGAMKFDPKTGKYTGIDEDVARGLQSGAIGREELMARAQKLTKEQKMSAMGHIQSASVELAGQGGLSAAGSFIKGAVGARYGENAGQLLMTKYGFSETEADLTESMAGQVGLGNENQGIFAKIRAREAQIKEQTDPKAIWERAKTKMYRKSFGVLEKAGAKFYSDMQKTVEDFVDDLTGRAVVTMSESGAKRLSSAFSGGGKAELNNMLSQVGSKAAQNTMGGSLRSQGLTAAGALGGAYGGAVGAGIDLFTGGAFGATFGATKALAGAGADLGNRLGNQGGYGRGIRDTELAAWFMGGGDTSTGRSSKGQFLHDAEDMGVDVSKLSGLSPAAADAAVQARRDKFASMSGGLEGIARQVHSEARSSQEGASWEDASLEKRMDITRKAVEARETSLSRGKFFGMSDADKEYMAKTAAVRQAAKASNADVSAAITSALYGTGKMGKAAQSGSAAAMSADANTQDMATRMKTAEEGLGKVLGDADASILKAKPELASVLKEMHSNPGLHDTIMTGTPDEIMKALKAAGLPGDGNDIAALKSMAAKLDTSKKEGDINSVVNYSSLVQEKDNNLFRESAGRAVFQGMDEDLGAALGSIASGKGVITSQEKEGVNASLAKLTARLSKATGPEREKLLKSMGGFAGGMADAVDLAKGLGKHGAVTQEKLAKQLGMSVEELTSEKGLGAGDFVGGKLDLSKKGIQEEVRNLAASRSLAGGLLKDKDNAKGDTNVELKATLDKLNIAVDNQTTVLKGLQNGTGLEGVVVGGLRDGASVVGKAYDKLKGS
jgi:hypothetical protein